MKQTDFRDVPDELWERMSLFLPRSNEKGVAAASPFRNVQSLLESSTNAGVDANGPCFPPAVAQKALSTSTSNAGAKPVSWRRFFAYSLRNMGKSQRRCPMASYGRTLPQGRALKKTAAESIERNPTDRGGNGGKIHLHVDGQGISPGVRLQAPMCMTAA